MDYFEKPKPDLWTPDDAEAWLNENQPGELSSAEELERSLCEDSLRWFIKVFWLECLPDAFESNWHIDCFADHLQAATDGFLQHILFNSPPRSTKSRPISVFWPVWHWLPRPKFQWLCVANTERLALQFSFEARLIIEHPKFQRYWGHRLRVRHGSNRQSEFDTVEGGKRLAVGANAQIVGSGGHGLIFDDPHDPLDDQDALNGRIDLFTKKLRFRANNLKTLIEVVAGQRVAPGDLSGWLLHHEREIWTGPKGAHVMLPSRFDPQRRMTTVLRPIGAEHPRGGEFTYPATWTDPRQNKGDLLHPARVGEAEERMIRNSAGDQAPGQLDQNPVPPGGLIFKAEGLGLEFGELIAEDCDAIITTLDASFEGESTSDYCSCHLMAKKSEHIFILDELYGQWTFPELCEEYREFIDGWNSILGGLLVANVVEKAANGRALIQTYQGKIPRILPYTPKTKKTRRFHAVAPRFAAKQAFFPRQGSVLVVGGVRIPLNWHFVKGTVTEMVSVPKAPNDDRADSITQGCLWLDDPDNCAPPEPEANGGYMAPEVDVFTVQRRTKWA